jgi:hypothetical protein
VYEVYLIFPRKIDALRILIGKLQEPNANLEESQNVGDNPPLQEEIGKNYEENDEYDDKNT